MKYFLDTEFIENGKTIDLISLAMVSEDDRKLYLINLDADLSKADDWINENVIPHLPPKPVNVNHTMYANMNDGIWMPHASFKSLIETFIGFDENEEHEFWAYYANYDWVAFCQCWGRMLDIPKRFPKYCLDIKQLALSSGVKKLKKPEKAHNAMFDAMWNKEQYEILMGMR